jgi:TonB family protein
MARATLIPFLILVASSTFAQSGRKGTSPTPSSSPEPTSSPSPDKLQLVNSKRPQFVDGERIFTSKEVDEKVHIIKRPPPRYTETARRLKTSGLIVLRMILAADASVKHIEIVKGLPDGLVESSMEAAARQIKLTPAKKDGKAVSVWVEVEYRFDIY